MLAMLTDLPRVPRILRLNIAGQPTEWVSWQEATCLYARDMVRWTVGDPILQIRGGSNRLSGEPSGLEIHAIIACEGRVFSREDVVPPLTNKALFGRDRNTCLYCAKELPSSELTRDHVMPVSKGGRDT